jgi:ligand-binding sensor domain-containing protein
MVRLVRGVARPIAMASSLVVTPAALLMCADPVHAQQHIVHTYTVADGLPSDRTSSVVTDRDGFVWICTANGLARFDGAEITSYGVEDGLPDPNVNHFLHARSGTRWAATNGGGVARLVPGTPGPDGRVFRAFAVGSSPRSMRVNVLFETRDGTLVAGTDGGLFRARENAAEPHFEIVPLELPGQPDAGLQIWALAEDGDGRLWVGSSAGLVHVGRWERLAHVRVAPAQGADHVRAIAVDSARRLWLGHDAGLIVWVPPLSAGANAAAVGRPLIEGATPCVSASLPAADARLPDASGAACHVRPGGAADHPAWVRGMLRSPDGWLWMTSSVGLLAYDGARFRRFEEAYGGSRHLAIDPGGDLWIGSNRGAQRVQRRGFTRYTLDTADGPITDGRPGRILSGPDGQLYAVSMNSTIHRFDGDGWTAIRPRLPRQVGAVGRSTYGAALLDHTGAWWIGTGNGLLRFPVVARLEDLAGVAPVTHYVAGDGAERAGR